MSLRPVVVSPTARELEVYVPAVGGAWGGFDQLREYLLKHHGASSLSFVDGPDARVCVLRVGSEDPTLELMIGTLAELAEGETFKMQNFSLRPVAPA